MKTKLLAGATGMVVATITMTSNVVASVEDSTNNMSLDDGIEMVEVSDVVFDEVLTLPDGERLEIQSRFIPGVGFLCVGVGGVACVSVGASGGAGCASLGATGGAGCIAIIGTGGAGCVTTAGGNAGGVCGATIGTGGGVCGTVGGAAGGVCFGGALAIGANCSSVIASGGINCRP